MLRLAVLVLILANVGYYGWSNGLLAPWGFAPHTEREPERLKQQIAPQSLQIVAPGGAVNAGQAQKPPTPPTAPAMAPVAPVPSPPGAPMRQAARAAPPVRAPMVACRPASACRRAP